VAARPIAVAKKLLSEKRQIFTYKNGYHPFSNPWFYWLKWVILIGKI
jgi:hypothetical protein